MGQVVLSGCRENQYLPLIVRSTFRRQIPVSHSRLYSTSSQASHPKHYSSYCHTHRIIIMYTTHPAPSVLPASDNSSAWTPLAIIGIVTSIIVLLLCIPLIAICMRRYERKRCKETFKATSGSRGSSRGSDGASQMEEGQSLKSIMVTRELQRSSLKVTKPEVAYTGGQERGWSSVEVRGGDGGWR